MHVQLEPKLKSPAFEPDVTRASADRSKGDDGDPRRVLFVSYEFPPVGGAGVQRVAKFAKYLPRKGWSVSILTVRNPSVPVTDSSLLADIPTQTLIRKAATLEPGYRLKAAVSAGELQSKGSRGGVANLLKRCLREVANLLLQPDPQILWAPSAIREGLKLLREQPHAAIVASGPPFSSLLIGAFLSRRTGLPLVLDYRDEWGISNECRENRRPNRLSQFVQNALQKSAIRTSSVVTATTRSSARSLHALCAAYGAAARVEAIYNGFDPEDFPEIARAESEQAAPQCGRYRLAYIGTLWNLTDASPLVTAVESLAKTRPELTRRLELVFAGRRTGAQEAVLTRLEGLPCTLIRLPYVDHEEAIRLVRSADGLCVLLADSPGAGRVMPAKVFEYMAARRHVLAITPPGELWDVVRSYPGGRCFLPADTDAIAAGLAAQIERAERSETTALHTWDSSDFSRDSQTQHLANLLDSLVTSRSTTAVLNRGALKGAVGN